MDTINIGRITSRHLVGRDKKCYWISIKNRLFIFLVFFIGFASFSALAQNDDYKANFTEAQIEQMLAPIALYPDSLLTHILIASTYPLEIIQANRWVNNNPNVSSSNTLSRVEHKEWDPSVKALIPFPRILKRLSYNLDWTQNLGDAFLEDEEKVLDSIQSLRRQADREGNLEKMERVNVIREKKVIIIEPVSREVVYVPYYDTRFIYGSWGWSSHPPVYWRHPHYHHNHGPFYWNPSVHIALNIFPSAFHWHNRHIVVLNRHRHHRTPHYYHRSSIIRHESARRWSHNPSHRRGIAYRSTQTRQRFHSSRPSRAQTRINRHTERRIVANKQSRISRSINEKSHSRKQTHTRQTKLKNRLSRSNTNRKPTLQNSIKHNSTQHNPTKQSLPSRSNRKQSTTSNQQKSVSRSNNTNHRNSSNSNNNYRNNNYRSNNTRKNSTRNNTTKRTKTNTRFVNQQRKHVEKTRSSNRTNHR